MVFPPKGHDHRLRMFLIIKDKGLGQCADKEVAHVGWQTCGDFGSIR